MFQRPDETLPLPPIYLTQSSVDETDENEEVDEIEADADVGADTDVGVDTDVTHSDDKVRDVDVIPVDSSLPIPQVPVRTFCYWLIDYFISLNSTSIWLRILSAA